MQGFCMRAVIFFLTVVLGANAFAGDSTGNANPAVVMRTGTPLAACATPLEEAVSTSGRMLKCLGGVWTYQGVTGIERVFVSRKITAADVWTNVFLTANCPAGKRVLDGGCALLSGLNYDDGQLINMDMAGTDLRSWNCGYGILSPNATKQYYFFGWADAAISAEAYCGIY